MSCKETEKQNVTFNGPIILLHSSTVCCCLNELLNHPTPYIHTTLSMNPAFVTITTFHSWTRVTVIFTLTPWPSRLRHVRAFNLTAARCDKTNLKVKVGDFPGMEVVDPLQDLFDELSGLLLAQRLLLCQEVKQLPPGDPATQTLIIYLHYWHHTLTPSCFKIYLSAAML